MAGTGVIVSLEPPGCKQSKYNQHRIVARTPAQYSRSFTGGTQPWAPQIRGIWFTRAAAVLFAALFALILVAAREAVPPANPAEDSETQFAFNAVAGGMSEVKLGTLAAQKGNDPSVEQFGQRMVTDHSRAGDKLKSIAIQSKITLPADASPTRKPTPNFRNYPERNSIRSTRTRW